MLEQLKAGELVTVYNHTKAIGPAITRFMNRDAALRRTRTVIEQSGKTEETILRELGLAATLQADADHLAENERQDAEDVAPEPRYNPLASAATVARQDEANAQREAAAAPMKPGNDDPKGRLGRDRVVEDDEGYYAIVNGIAYGTWATKGAAQAGLQTEQARAAARGRTEPRGPKKPTENQQTIIDLCLRPNGATTKEILAAVGWPSLATDTVCRGLAERFGYQFGRTERSAASPSRYWMLKPATA